MRKPCLILIGLLALLTLDTAEGACGGTVRTWDAGGGNSNWSTNSNWSSNNQPNTTAEDAVIVSGDTTTTNLNQNRSVGCVEVQSGVLLFNNNRTLSVYGDYFRALNENTVYFVLGPNAVISMRGTAAQTLEVKDDVSNVLIRTNQQVTLTESFSVTRGFSWQAGNTGTVVIDADVVFDAAVGTVTIPSSATLEIASGASLTISGGGLNVNGTLKIKAGGTLKIGNGSTLAVASGGLMQLSGASGNVATVTSTGSGSSFTFTLAGSLDAEYFRVDRLDASGIDVAATGVIQTLDYGAFHFLADSGYALTLASGATIPSTADGIGFFDDDDHGTVLNVDANSYNGSDITFTNFVGSVAGEANDTDPNNKIDWGTAGPTRLTLSENTASGSPPATITANTNDELFATFAFALNQSDTETDITEITFTMTGTGSSGDIDTGYVYSDTGGSTDCGYDSGSDTQIGSDLVFSGSPPTATVSLSGGDVISTNSDTDVKCIHVVLDTSSIAQTGKTLQISIVETDDVTNSEDYDFSETAGPEVNAGTSQINNGFDLRIWQGDSDVNFSTNNNWSLGNAPTSTVDCVIGSGIRVTRLNSATQACENGQLNSGGTLDWNNTTNEIGFYGNLQVDSGYTFDNATSGPGVLAFRGTTNQSFSLGTELPASLLIANTGTSPNDVVSVDTTAKVANSVTISNGTLRIESGVTLTVDGNVTVQSGAVLDIQPGGTLALGDGHTLTVNSGGTLEVVGTSGQNAVVTSETPQTDAYNVVINGTIEARYYKFDSLGSGGVSIEAGATIDPTNHLQNGSFTYPVDSSMSLLQLKRQVPGNSMDNMNFELNGSAATSITNVNTTGAAAGTLTINSYSGDVSGPSFDTDPTYGISWSGATNTIVIAQDNAGPATVSAGGTYKMGRFSFEQDQAGASFSDADITELTLTLTGDGSGGDVDEVRVFYDDDCDSSAGSLVGTGTFSGNPAEVTFSIGAGEATVEADVTTPPTRCVYVEYDIANGAQDGKTLGVKLDAAGDFTNDQSYAASGSTTFPVTLGTPATISGSAVTVWLGTTSTDWTVASNWSAGVPDSTKTCEIGLQSNQPVVPIATTASCDSVIIDSGATLTLTAATSDLDVYGAFENNGTFTQNLATVTFRGSGDHTITSSSTLGNVAFNKTAGTVQVSGSVTINALMLIGTSVVDFVVGSGKTLILPNGITISGADTTLEVQGSGVLEIGSGQMLMVAGGTFLTSGVADQFPQSTANKAQVKVQGGTGTWGFLASSGTVSLSGFLLDDLDTNGVRFSGTSTLSVLEGGQLRNLSETYGSVNGFQFNTSNVPATANDIGWNWGPDNTPPGTGDGYLLASSTGCGSNTITFDRWFGDFFVGFNQPDTSTKVSATNCTISIAASASPVSLTNFFATGYDEVVSLDWITGLETNHRGFNVYRSDKPYAGYVQVNSALVQNTFFSTSYQGVYRFLDPNVTNGKRYYYILEDVAYNGEISTHGPVSVIPMADNGAPPATEPETSTGTASSDADTGNGPVTGDIANGKLIDLGNGAHILAQTSDTFRIEVIPPAASYSVSDWDGAYEEVEIPGYSRSLVAGHPELPERFLLIEVPASVTSVSVLNSTAEENGVSTHQIQPAPAWSPDGDGQLQPSYAPDTAAYNAGDHAPSSFFALDPEVQKVGDRSFAKIRVSPLLFRGSDNQIRSLQRLVLDVGLNGGDWQTSAAEQSLALSPSAVEGVLRMRVNQRGMYQVDFEDLVELGVEGPFNGVALSSLRLYTKGIEVPLEVVSADGVFGSGDSVRFWASPVRHKDTDFGEWVLATQPLGENPSGSALRVTGVNLDPTGLPQSDQFTSRVTATAEQDLKYLSDLPLGEQEDHFFWGRIFTEANKPTTDFSFFDVPIDLAGLWPNDPNPVRLVIYVRGQATGAANVTNHLGVWVNAVPFRVANVRFPDHTVERLVVDIPAHYFVDGVNQLRLESMGDTVPSGSFEILDIDRVEADYYALHESRDGVATVTYADPDRVVRVDGFAPAASVHVYDVTDYAQLAKGNSVVTYSPDGGASQSVEFAVTRGEALGFRYLVLEEDRFLSPAEMFLEPGFEQALRSESREADLIIIGREPLLQAAGELVTHRETQGLRVATVPLAQVYAEFGHGLPVTESIRDFLTFARTSWLSPSPRYVLFLGDATSDPRGRLGSTSGDLMPVPLESGFFSDFGSDNWYVREEGQLTPQMAVGRIPSEDPEVIRDFVRKLVLYESGTLAPGTQDALKMTFVSDSDGMNEKFQSQSSALADAIRAQRPQFTVDHLDRRAVGSDAQAKEQINQFIESSPLVVNYLGHGAEGMWASGAFYTDDDAAALRNEKLPLVVALNCLNAFFYRPDGARTLGEAFVLNPEGGSVAFWGSTALTVPGAQLTLAQAFYGQIAQETAKPYRRVAIGDVIRQAKLAVGSAPTLGDALKSYTLIGDPSMPLPKAAFAPTPAPAPALAPPVATPTGGGCGAARWPVSPSDAGFGFPIFLLWLWTVWCRRRNPTS